MSYEYEKNCAVRELLEDLDNFLTWMKHRRLSLLADLVTLEREDDERAMARRRKRRKDLARFRYYEGLREAS